MKIIRCKNGNIMMTLKEIEDVSFKEIKANAVDAAVEKHVPQYNFKDNQVEVFVNHVMEKDHYIEWIMIDYGNKQMVKHFKPGEEAKVMVEYHDGMKAYSYCNKHSLWVCDDIRK